MKKYLNKQVIYISIMFVFLAFMSILGYVAREGHKQDEIRTTQSASIQISQYQLCETYGWKDIILWSESKDNFERAYNTKLHWLNYAMGFQRDINCSDPIGGGGEWQYDKKCFKFVCRPNLPNMLDEIASQSKGKTLVIIGSINDNNQRFSGNVYWY